MNDEYYYLLFFMKSIKKHHYRSCRQNIEIYVIEVLNNNVGKIIIIRISLNLSKFLMKIIVEEQSFCYN